MMFVCCDQRRLDVLRRAGSRNAMEFVEVLDHAAPPGVSPQRTLFVRLLHPLTAQALAGIAVRIDGGERIRTVDVEWIAMGNALPATAEPGLVDGIDELPRTLVIRTTSAGDFSRYRLALVRGNDDALAPDEFDPLLSSIDFSFKVECATDFDCDAPLPCPPVAGAAPRIDYLAKDYAGFRRLMLDRLALSAREWSERSPADLGVALVELLAFAADTLSYRQDAIANEAYLNTARRRVSVRRHARLVDYVVHEGCNARAFVHFKVKSGTVQLPAHTQLLTRVAGAAALIRPGSGEERRAREANALVFETAHAATLVDSLNDLDFYTWGDTGCCLPRGATRATLLGHVEDLDEGDFLLFEEVLNPVDFTRVNVDPAHRHLVRLTKIVHDADPSGGLFRAENAADVPEPITRIEWDPSDALPFALCVSAQQRPDQRVSVARGNIVLVDHGETKADEELPTVTDEKARYARATHHVGDCCDDALEEPRLLPLRYRPLLAAAPLTHGFDLQALLHATGRERWSAAALRALDPRDAMPEVQLACESRPGMREPWVVRRDLLGSSASAAEFTVEVQDDGRARLRFGDDVHGRRPDDGMVFEATYRVGNGTIGNVGADAIAHLVTDAPFEIDTISNPLPAFGGVDPEDIEAARRDAPHAYRTQLRAVTAADYAHAAARTGSVQRAAATFRWTGSWHTVFVTADRIDGAPVDPGFERRLRGDLEPFRVAGYDLEVDGPRFVPLDVSLHICVKPDYVRGEVLRAVSAVLSNRRLSDGRRGAFHPDNFTFGQPVYSSRIVAAAQSVAGVDSVRCDRFGRLGDPDPASLESGVIPIGRLEIAQLENNPNFRERGRLSLSAGGGK